MAIKNRKYETIENQTFSDIVCESSLPLFYNNGNNVYRPDPLNVLSLFSGCGGMDLGFEGHFICHKKSVGKNTDWIDNKVNENWVMLNKTRFNTIFANDILKEAFFSWTNYMKRFGKTDEVYHFGSIVDLVKMYKDGKDVFPTKVDIVTGGFPCQDFSVAGKRRGFDSKISHNGHQKEKDEPSEETRGKLYYWMKQVIEIVSPKIFVAENVKGLVSLGDVKDIIQKDFQAAGNNGYYVFTPQVLHAGNYGVPETRERVIFIGARLDALNETARRVFEKGEIPSEYNPYPKATHDFNLGDESLPKPVTCEDVLSELLEPGDSKDLSQQHYSKAKYMGMHCQGQSEINYTSLELYN